MIQELRIGNYVQAPLGEIMQVDILGHKENTNYIHAISDEGAGINGFTPITLTEEWLLKFGFVPEKMEDGFLSYRLKFVDISMPYFEFTYDYGTESFEVKYVHQLQNLFFALTGTELTLNTKKC